MKEEVLCRSCLELLDEAWQAGKETTFEQVGHLVFELEYISDFNEMTGETTYQVISGSSKATCPIYGTEDDYFIRAALVQDLPSWLLAQLRLEHGLSQDDVQCQKCGRAMISSRDRWDCICGNFLVKL